MNFVLQIVFLALGFFLLVKGADWFVDGASGLARKLGIPQLVIGLTIVAMGTSLPEAAVSISAALRGNAEITIGNIVGSNILNILIILGVTALIATLKVADSTVRYEIPFMIVVTFVLLWLGYTGGQVTRLEGIILWVLFLLYLRYLYMMAKKGKEEEREAEQLSTAKIIGLILAGVVMIVAGSNFAVEGASNLAKALGISQRFIGLTIVALGTSLPELVTSVSAARKHNADIAIGNIVGILQSDGQRKLFCEFRVLLLVKSSQKEYNNTPRKTDFSNTTSRNTIFSKSKRGDRFTVISSLYTLYEHAPKGLLKKEHIQNITYRFNESFQIISTIFTDS